MHSDNNFLLEKLLFADSHCDTVTKSMDTGNVLYENNLHWDIKRCMSLGKPYLQFFAVFVDEGQDKARSFEKTCEYIDFYNSQINENNSYISHCNNFTDIKETIKNKKIAALLAVEDAACVEGSIDKLDMLYEKGVRGVTLTWNYTNEISDGCLSDTNNGLSMFGEELVKHIREKKMILDVSHLSEKGFYDVCRLVDYPIFATHSCCNSVSLNKRNLKDWQLIEIGRRGGYTGICFYPPFLSCQNEAGIDDILRHIYHAINFCGKNNTGMGSDFDGIKFTVPDIDRVEKIEILYERMLKYGFGKEVVKKFMGENLYNAIKKVI